jgi:putative flippase GtrA
VQKLLEIHGSKLRGGLETIREGIIQAAGPLAPAPPRSGTLRAGVLAGNFARALAHSPLSSRLLQFSGWFVLGVLAFGFEVGLLAVMHQWWGMHLWLASALAAEIVLLGRFLSTDRLVFGHVTPSLQRCWRFHLAALGSFTVSWLVLNASAHVLACPYAVAAFLGSIAAFGWSGVTNFLWVWRR